MQWKCSTSTEVKVRDTSIKKYLSSVNPWKWKKLLAWKRQKKNQFFSHAMQKLNLRPLLEQQKASKSDVNPSLSEVHLSMFSTPWKFDDAISLTTKKKDILITQHDVMLGVKKQRICAFVCAFSENDPIIDFSPPLLLSQAITTDKIRVWRKKEMF